MALRNPFSITRAAKSFQLARQCVRTMYSKSAAPQEPRPLVPSPTPFVPDVETFLKLIGRGMSKHASKISSWEQMFTLKSHGLRDIGIDPPRERRYLLRKLELFRLGKYGPGGDLEHVVDGAAQLRVVQIPVTRKVKDGEEEAFSVNLTPGMRRVIVNLPPDATEYIHNPSKQLKRFAYMKFYDGMKIKGQYLEPIKGTKATAAIIRVREGMWEDKRGHKVDGGERRQAEVRAKKRAEERRKQA
ncbi:IGR protein motif-domain-containing protein [Aspergillus granulosus]|uniref:Small ribosomal subunit protein mS41 n=1 Tax=Aspergillus granulosus TaxID=176169 RepID=A0ABR4HZU7_9EURO